MFLDFSATYLDLVSWPMPGLISCMVVFTELSFIHSIAIPNSDAPKFPVLVITGSWALSAVKP
jgi:hypothetical protein